MRIAIVIPYFGRWPQWFLFFLRSCEFNRDVDWIVYTDCDFPDYIPSNVRFVFVSYQSYKQKISDRLSIIFDSPSPYKLCDLKPALGYIHEDDLKGYDVWGFSDLDLLYGDLRKFFTDEKLSKYKLISTHKRRVSGHFCLMHNTTEMREAFMQIKNWETHYADSKHSALDEGACSKIFIRNKNLPRSIRNCLGKLNKWRRNSEFSEHYTTPNAGVPWLDGSHNFPTEWYWCEGKITNNLTGSREYPYFHFFAWKNFHWDEKNSV